MATQLRLRSAKLLIINLGGLGTEILKNLVLGGINSIEILDGSTIKEEDFASQFFLPNDDSLVGTLKLPAVIDNVKDLNNRVDLTINTSSLNDIFQDPSYFSKFDLIIATELTKSEILNLNKHTRKLNVPLYVGGLHGMFGYILTDLIQHHSVSEKDAGNIPRMVDTKLSRNKVITKVERNEETKKESVTILDTFAPLSTIFESKELLGQLNKRQMKRLSASLPLIFTLFEVNKPSNPEDIVNKKELEKISKEICSNFGIPDTCINDEYLDYFCNQAFAEFSPSAAILGGCLAQDVIQFLSKKESPINNVLILDCIKMEMPIYLL